MKEQDDELRDLFREKNLENAFPANEAHWKVLSAEIEANKKRKRRFFFYLSSLLLTGVCLLAYLCLATMVESQADKVVHQPAPQTQLGDSRKVSKENSSPSNQPNSESKSAPAALSSGLMQKVRTTPPTTFETKGVVPSKTNAGTPPDDNPISQASQQVSSSNPPFIANTATSAVFTKETLKPHDATEANPVQQANTKDSEIKPSAIDSSATVSTKPSPAIEQDIKSAPMAASASETKPLRDSLLSLNPTSNSVDSLSTLKPDTTLTKTTNITEPLQINPLLGLHAEAGMVYTNGWTTGSGREANGLNPLLGLHYFHPITAKLGVSGGIQYQSLLHMGQSSHTTTATRVRFGEETEQTVITTLSMHYLLVPVKLNLNLNTNNFIGIGYTFGYLLDTRSRIDTYQSSLGNRVLTSQSFSRGYSKGFNPYDGQLTFLYRRRLYKELFAAAEAYYGLLDLKYNRVYQWNQMERALGLRLSLSLKIWNK